MVKTEQGVSHKGYWIEPNMMLGIMSAIAVDRVGGFSFAQACVHAAENVTDELVIQGVENIPARGSLLIVGNHPSHFDFIFGACAIGATRPDVKVVAKKSTPLIHPSLTDAFLFLDKDESSMRVKDIRNILTYLANGRSLAMVPWGSLDHRAYEHASIDRSINNILRLSEVSGATVLPLHIDVEWTEGGRRPLKKATVSIKDAIMLNDKDGIAKAISTMYAKYVGLQQS